MAWPTGSADMTMSTNTRSPSVCSPILCSSGSTISRTVPGCGWEWFRSATPGRSSRRSRHSRPLHSNVLVVGAGSAGCVVAERLSADERCRVTVLEAGPALSDPEVVPIVGDVSVLPVGAASPIVHRYPTILTEEPHRSAQLVRGAVVGGSGTVNGGYFCRGLQRDFDGWGMPGWSWRDVLAHFRAIENDRDFGGPAHGDRGPIAVQRVAELCGATADFV